MTQRYTVPEGGLKVVDEAISKARGMGRDLIAGRIRDITLEAFIRWQSENPPVPTEEQCLSMTTANKKATFGTDGWEWIRWGAVEWLRRMYIALEPEPAVNNFSDIPRFNAFLERPACVKDEPVSVRERQLGIREHVLCVRALDYDQLLVAYRRCDQHPK